MSQLDKLIAAITPPESAEKRAQARLKARQVAQPGDWLSLILDHHEQIEQAFAAVTAASDAQRRRQALKTLGTLLNGHAMAEEAVVYPALFHAGQKLQADMAYAEQIAAKMQMAALERMEPMSEDFEDKLGHLEGAVGHHVFEEENGWFIALKQTPTADQAMIAKRYREEYDRYMKGGDPASEPGRRAPSEPRSFDIRPETL